MMNKKTWIGIYAASLALCAAASAMVIILLVFENLTESLARQLGLMTNDVTALALAIGILAYSQFALLHVVYNLVAVSAMWGAIQDGKTPVTVGRAVGFLFVPVFNVYWIFKVWAGFAAEYNEYVARYRLNVPPLSGGIFTLYPVLLVLSGIFFVPALLLLPLAFVAAAIKTCDAVNALNEAVAQRRAVVAAAQKQFRQNQLSGQHRSVGAGHVRLQGQSLKPVASAPVRA